MKAEVVRAEPEILVRMAAGDAESLLARIRSLEKSANESYKPMVDFCKTLQEAILEARK